LAVILGARVITRELIDAVKVPIINFHPGVLPDNRGLYNLHWAVLNHLPQGVTTHVISHAVDRGEFVLGELIPVYPQDTLMDIGFRLANREMAQLTQLMDLLASNGKLKTEGKIGEGRYNPHIDGALEYGAQQLLAQYASRYPDYVDRFLTSSRFDYSWSVIP
jgi:methionyl-tRNA formyltransferase